MGRVRRKNHQTKERVLRDPPFGAPKGRAPIQTTLTDELCRNICEYVYMGAPYDIAAEACGVPASTELNWRRFGASYIAEIEDGTAPEFPQHVIFAQYARAVITARAKWQMRVLRRSFQDSFRSTWIRDLAILERRDPNNWRLRDEDVMADQEAYEQDETFL